MIIGLSGWSQSPIQITKTVVEQIAGIGESENPEEIELRTTIQNVSNQTIALKWTKYVLDLPPVWEAEVYDKELCYLPNAYTNYDPGYFEAPVELIPGESFDLVLHVLTHGKAGVGAFEFPISLINQPDEVLETVTFYPQVIEQEVQRSASLKLYPNPAEDYFRISGDEHITKLMLYNSIGQPVRQYTAVPGQRYDISDLPEGLYLLGLLDQKGETKKTLRLMKRLRRA
ncbi:MAG: hypothetical protein DHS20C18_25700 [Saprospiraceae bacterium]|nr:MAG: hypothetical protein DHS20C18_25700 [Saprospiraceae bacterium]